MTRLHALKEAASPRPCLKNSADLRFVPEKRAGAKIKTRMRMPRVYQRECKWEGGRLQQSA